MFDEVAIGNIYVVQAIKTYSGHPFYFVSIGAHADSWALIPGLCFVIVDDRPSSLWRYRIESSENESGIVCTLAIREWVEEREFFERLMDSKEREVKIMAAAAAFMTGEFE